MTEDLQDIIVLHVSKYPMMQPCDAVKLIFQNEFGGGHLITDAKKSLENLKKEFEQCHHAKDVELFETIGNDMYRLNLNSAEIFKLPIEKINEIFLLSAASVRGCLDIFQQKLQILRDMADMKAFHFTLNELDLYLDEYIKSGYPVVSHSVEYRNQYCPSYRVVSAKYCIALLKK